MTREFIIDGLTRTGSTTLARLLNRHPRVRCLIEPFHPGRYDGQFYQMACSDQTVSPALTLIWHRWNGIKHVWEANGWPFANNPTLNDEIALSGAKVVYVRRRNLLQRAVSSIISKQLRFWVGPRDNFLARLEAIQLHSIDPSLVADHIAKDHAADERRWQLLQTHSICTFPLYYEDLYGPKVEWRTQYEIINSIFRFLGYEDVSTIEFTNNLLPLLNRDIYKWATPHTYNMLPGIQQIEEKCGSDETGWLFNRD